ncbi:alpha/beta fold hydrolase [Oryzobacter sp. R7]|uniref:alpha/beta fold hydrolase n=1 Tax=Oryzobacter faecalis TaxID=3388656 RepID=UPI00398D3617
MATISNGSVDLHVEDSGGEGRPVVLIHGWPLSGASWAPLLPALTGAGYRVVTYDRRGFGQSDKPGEESSYDYDTFAGDLDAVLTDLDLTDATLVGFSMGGGEVVRHLGTRGAERVRSAALLAAIPPNLTLDDDHPDGALDDATIRQMQAGLAADPPGFLDGFLTNFFSADGELKVTEEQRQVALGLAAQADVHAAVQCIRAWATDFDDDVAGLTVPVLVVHGDADAIVPIEKSGRRVADRVDSAELHVVAGGPHGIVDSHTDEVARVLLDFLAR